MLSKKLVKLFAKTFAKSVELPDTVVTYHKGGIVEMSREDVTKYYYFIKTPLNLIVAVGDELMDKRKVKGYTLLNLPEVVATCGLSKPYTEYYVFRNTLRLLTDAIVMDFFSPTPVSFGNYTGGDELCCEATGDIISAVEETISRRVGKLSSFNVELSGLKHYHINNNPLTYPYNHLILYQQGDCIIATVCKVEEDLRKVDFTYTLCKSYCTKSIAELTELVEDVIKTQRY